VRHSSASCSTRQVAHAQHVLKTGDQGLLEAFANGFGFRVRFTWRLSGPQVQSRSSFGAGYGAWSDRFVSTAVRGSRVGGPSRIAQSSQAVLTFTTSEVARAALRYVVSRCIHNPDSLGFEVVDSLF
jgi:hypothetical protein